MRLKSNRGPERKVSMIGQNDLHDELESGLQKARGEENVSLN